MPRRPQILVLDEESTSLFSDVFNNLISVLKRSADVIVEPEPVKAASLLQSGVFSVAFVVWPMAYLSTLKPNRSLRDYVRNFAEHQGGTVLFCGTFGSFIRPTDFNLYFGSEWQLPWRFGDYNRSTFTLNPEFSLVRNDSDGSGDDLQTSVLERAYSQKAIHIKGAARHAMLYIPTSQSQIESSVWAPMPVNDLTQSPTVFQTYGKGHVGFLGDVNSETGTTKAVVALCRLSSGIVPSRVTAGSRLPDAGGWYCAGCGKQESSRAGTAFKRCGACQVCHYCSVACQTNHWSEGHKKLCKFMKDDDEAELVASGDEDEYEDFDEDTDEDLELELPSLEPVPLS